MHSATPTLHGWLHICGARAQNFQPGRTSRAKWRQSARNERRHNEKSVWSGAIMTTFKLNDQPVSVNVAEDTPLLWVIRDEIGLKGTKFGCGIGMCGACTVHIDGRAVRSCITPLGTVANAAVTTIEGLDPHGQHPLQKSGSRRRRRNAAIASPDRSCRPQLCSRIFATRATRTS